MRSLLTIAAIWLTQALLRKILSLRAASRLLSIPHAGILLLHPFRHVSVLLGHWYPFSHQLGSWYADFSPYVKYGCTCLSTTVWSGALPTVWLADADAIRTVTADSNLFQKDVEAYEALNFYGKNLVSSEGADWKRHRNIAKPAFNETANAFVWSETIRVTNEWFADLDEIYGREPLTLDVMKNLLQATLLVISSVGFGRRVSWQDDSFLAPTPGHTLAFRTALFDAIKYLFVKVMTPAWLYAVSGRVPLPLIGPLVVRTQSAYKSLQLHLMDLISLSRAWVLEGKASSSHVEAGLLRNLVEANMTADLDWEDGHSEARQQLHKSLTDDELLSNSFAFLLAGHETTAHSLTFAIGLMALYPDVQQKIYEEAVDLWPSGLPPTASSSSHKESMPNLKYTTATFHETIRLFPAIRRLMKLVTCDTEITAHSFTQRIGALGDIEEITVPLKAGCMVMIDILGLHTNPMYWGRDAREFKPERFIDTESYRWPREAFLAFSAGSRNCIGQRFAITESVCMLASLVRRFEISLPEHMHGLSFEEQKRRLLSWVPGVTLTPTGCFVRLQRRP